MALVHMEAMAICSSLLVVQPLLWLASLAFDTGRDVISSSVVMVMPI